MDDSTTFMEIFKLLNFISDFVLFRGNSKQSLRNYKKRCRERKKWVFWLDLFVVFITVRSLVMYILITRSHLERIKYLTKFIRPTFSEMNIFVSLNSLNATTFILVSYIILPRLIEGAIIALDLRPIKFILESRSEIEGSREKTTLVIDELIDFVDRKRADTLNQIDELYDIELNQSCFRQRSRTNPQRGSIWNSLEFCREQLINLRSNPEALKPISNSHTELIARIKLQAKFLFILCTGSTVMFFIIESYTLMGDRCKVSKGAIGSCNVSILFNANEISGMIELLAILALSYISFVFYMLMMTVCSHYQINLIRNFHSDLLGCRNQLHCFNNRLFTVEEKEVFKIVQETLIHTRVFDNDIRKGVKLLNSLVSVLVIITIGLNGGILFASASNTRRSGDKLFLFALFSCITLFCLNTPALLVAYINARLMDSLKLYWSIRSELLRHLDRHPASRANMSYLLDQWVELEGYWFNANANVYFAGSFGIEFTYQRVIEFNFYILSVIPILFK